MEPLPVLAAITVVAIAAFAWKVRRARKNAQGLVRRGQSLVAKEGRSLPEEAELQDISRRLASLAGPLYDFRLDPLTRLRSLPADTYQLVTTGIDGTEDPRELEEFAQLVAFVHLGGGSGSVRIWADQALEFGRHHYIPYYDAEVAAGSDSATADRTAKAKVGDLLAHYFPFAVHRRADP